MNDERLERILQMVEGKKQRQRLKHLMEGSDVRPFAYVQHGQDLPRFEKDETPDIDTEELRDEKDGKQDA